jgi:tetratricopeptide (TPR) repeat protein
VKIVPGKLHIRSIPDKATVFIDGQQKGDTSSEIEVSPGGHKLRLEYRLYKPSEENISLESGGTMSIQRTLQPLRAPGRFALLIGIRNANDRLPIFRHAPADMAELGRTLVAAGFPKENVTILAQTSGSDTERVPSAERINLAVKALVTDRYPGDTLLLALAGPAVVLPGGTASYFCPAGADLGNPRTLISLQATLQEFAACPAETKIALIDGNRVAPPLPGRPSAAVLEEQIPFGVTALTAIANGEPGFVYAADRHGAFWYFVLEGLRGAADANRDNKVTVGELAEFVATEVRKHVAEQFKAIQTPNLIDRGGRAQAMTLAMPDASLKKLAEGNALLRGEQYAGAEAKYSEALAIRPELVEALLQRAVAHYYQKKYAEMIADCSEALRIDPESAAAYDYRGDAHQENAGPLEGMDKRELRLAIDDYTASIAIDPDYGPVYKSRGATYGLLKDDANLVKDYTRAIELAPVPSARLFEVRARALRSLHKNNEAVKDLTDAIKLKPRDANLYRQLSAVYMELGEKELGEATRRKADELKKSQQKEGSAPGKS